MGTMCSFGTFSRQASIRLSEVKLTFADDLIPSVNVILAAVELQMVIE